MLPQGRIVAFTALVFQAPVYTFAQHTRTTSKIPKEVVEQIISGSEGECADPKSLTATWVDLDGDRVPELIVKMDNHCACGASGNCSHWVFQKTDFGYVTLLNGVSGQRVYSKTTSSNGLKDLVAEEHMSAVETSITVYKWDGTAYQPSSCFIKENVSSGHSKPVYKIRSTSCEPENSEQSATPARNLLLGVH